MTDRIERVVGLQDEDMMTVGVPPAPTVPAAARASARLSFDALARLFANHRPTLIDADLTTIPTRGIETPSGRDTP